MQFQPIVATATLIFQLHSGLEIGTTSGFFYEQNEKLFLVTHRQAVTAPRGKSTPDTLKLRLHKEKGNLKENAFHRIPLYKAGAPVWKSHPKVADIDVILIQLEREKFNKSFVIEKFKRDQILGARSQIPPEKKVFIVGYPFGASDLDHNLPEFRNAHVTAARSLASIDLPLFLTDAGEVPGHNGAPVITSSDKVGVYRLVGVHSNSVNPSFKVEVPTGKGVAWHAGLIPEIADTF